MDVVYFLLRYTPFWAVPTMLIGAEFAYIYWLKSRKKIVAFFIMISFFSFIMVLYYIFLGGPEKTVQKTISIVNEIKK